MTTAKIDFEVRTCLDAVAYTAASRDLAVAWIKARPFMPGLTVKEVTRWTTERTVYRPRPRLVSEADELSVPSFPEHRRAG